ncbi:MAG: DUF805 domain-containing protein [Deltaproteobacteria bacterium]|nr:DUF805 domain-containing protein [Deltaproteobacteria bacterium]
MEKFKFYFVNTLKNKYAAFKGRATRSEYWYFALYSMIIAIILAIIDWMIINPLLGVQPGPESNSTSLLGTIFNLAILIPSLALSIRRLHDIGKNGWWVLLALVPIVNFIGIFVILYFFTRDSQPGENQYGPNPKEV